MALTEEQINEAVLRGAYLNLKVEEFEPVVNKVIWSILLFVVIGIFFFPCLIIALILFAVRMYMKNWISSAKEEIAQLESIPEVMDRVEQIIAEGREKEVVDRARKKY